MMHDSPSGHATEVGENGSGSSTREGLRNSFGLPPRDITRTVREEEGNLKPNTGALRRDSFEMQTLRGSSRSL